MVHDVLGDISRTADTLVLYKTVWGKHVCTVNVWDWRTGPLRGQKKSFWGGDGLMDGAGLVPMLLWTEWVFGGKHSISVSPVAAWGRGQDGSSCLSVWHPDWRGGSPKLLRPWVWPEREGGRVSGQWPRDQNSPPFRSLYDRSFFWCFWCSY